MGMWDSSKPARKRTALMVVLGILPMVILLMVASQCVRP